MKKIIIISILFLFFSIIFSHFTNAAIKINFDTFQNVDSGLPNFISELYKFAVIISGVLALLMIVWGGIQYQLAGAIPQKENEAKDIILNALWGLLLLLGAYVILRTVNPVLVELQDPSEGLGNVFIEECTKDTVIEILSDGTKIKARACVEGESPRDPKTGKCICYPDDVWLATYYAAIEESPEGDPTGDLTCNTQESLQGQQAASKIMNIGNSFIGILTYTQGAGRNRPDLGKSDCSGFGAYLYKCVMNIPDLGNSGSMASINLPDDKLERLTGPDKETNTQVGDIIGMTRDCKRTQRPKAGSGHVMIVSEKQNNKITKILHVAGKEGGRGGAYNVSIPNWLLQAYRTCGFTIHIKR